MPSLRHSSENRTPLFRGEKKADGRGEGGGTGDAGKEMGVNMCRGEGTCDQMSQPPCVVLMMSLEGKLLSAVCEMVAKMLKRRREHGPFWVSTNTL